MKNLDILFKTYLSANGGNNESMWYIIKRFERYIDFASSNNMDLKHSIILSLFDLSEKLDMKFDEFFKEINQ